MSTHFVTWLTTIEGSVEDCLAITEVFRQYLECKKLICFVSELAFVYLEQRVQIWGCSTFFVHNHLLLELVRSQVKLGQWRVLSQRLTSTKENPAYRSLVSHQFLQASPTAITPDYQPLISQTKNFQMQTLIKAKSWLPAWLRSLLRW
jgi:hypothetical protein